MVHNNGLWYNNPCFLWTELELLSYGHLLSYGQNQVIYYYYGIMMTAKTAVGLMLFFYMSLWIAWSCKQQEERSKNVMDLESVFMMVHGDSWWFAMKVVVSMCSCRLNMYRFARTNKYQNDVVSSNYFGALRLTFSYSFVAVVQHIQHRALPIYNYYCYSLVYQHTTLV